MEEATHLAVIIVSTEALWRISRCSISSYLTYENYLPSLLFFTAFVLCIAAVYLDVKNISYFQTPLVRNTITFLHACDGLIALAIGIAFYINSSWLLAAGIVLLSKFFLLYLLSRMVTGVKAYDKFSVAVQTTKTFIHHNGSFFFITDPTVAIITGIWRFVSMNGHAALTLRDKISPELYNTIMWSIAHQRNIVIVFILFLCFISPEIMRGFGKFLL